MNYKKSVENILEAGINDKVQQLAGLLISKLMYITQSEADEIEILISTFFSSNVLSEQDIILLEVCAAFFQYKKGNFENVIQRLDIHIESNNPNIDSDYFVAYFTAIGTSLRSLGQLDAALGIFQKAIDYGNIDTNHLYSQFCYALSLYHIGEIYGELQDFESMLERHLKLYHSPNSDIRIRSLNGIGRGYIGLNQFDNALFYLKKANDEIEKGANIPFLARNCHDLGFAYFKLEQFDIATKYYQEALQLRQENQLTNASTTTLMAIGDVCIAQGKWQRAIDNFNEALVTAKIHKANRKIVAIYKKLSYTYEKLNQSKEALSYFKQFHYLKNEIDNVQHTQIENQKIREINAELQQQKALMAKQTQELKTTLGKLKITNKYLENFASVAAHDLKAPIRIASTFAKILERKYGKLDEKDAEHFQFISTNVQRLSRMIDDLLSLSKLDQGLPRPRIVYFKRIINEVKLRLNERITKTNATIILPSPMPLLKGHDSLLTQLFQNFIDNAIKYSKQGISPKIVINTVLDKENGYYEFEIQDNGRGIEEVEQPYIFELFNGTYRNDSSGIGLATCRKIVTHYGGTIWLKSQENIGTSIFFTLPAQII